MVTFNKSSGAQAITEKAMAALMTRTTAELLQLWRLSETAPITAELATTRGWLMDELERRDPEAFDRWMDSTDPDAQPDAFFAAR